MKYEYRDTEDNAIANSRPHPAPAPIERQPCKYVAGEFCDHCIDSTCKFYPFDKQHDAAIRAAIARQARERVLDAGISLIQKRIDGIFEAYRGEENENHTARPFAAAEGMDEAIKMLESLRGERDE